MNAFISHAIHPNEQYIVSLLARKLSEQQVGVVTNFVHSDVIDLQTAAQIRNAAMFIGLITQSAVNFRQNKVFTEFSFAVQNKRPAILLVEDRVPLPSWVNQQNIIIFNRLNINQAIEIANYHMEGAKKAKKASEGMAWLLGGLAVVALLAYLSDDKK
jgi:hypothetical protein